MQIKQLIGITSPPYEEAVDGGGIFKKGYVGNFSHSKNPDTVGNRTYSNKTHNFSKGQIGSLKSSSRQELDFDITQYHKCGGELYWHGCYDSDIYYKQFVTPESYAHPAKISFLLTERIFKTFEQSTLTGETEKVHKGRLSFFKRLSLAKGNKAAEFEDILIGVRI